MPKKYPKSEVAAAAEPSTEKAYITWGEDLASKTEALNASSEALQEYDGVQKTSGYSRYRTDFSNLDGNTGGRPGLTRNDYDYFRPDEAVPIKIKQIIRLADTIYHRVGLVKNVIDLMGDFGCQGIRLVHKNKKIERFYKSWFDKVSGIERSERFLNNLYRVGNVVINRQTAKISLKVSESMSRAVASPDLILSDMNMSELSLEKREIPWRYTFIDPFYVDVVGDSLSSFVGDKNKRYSITLPANLRRVINSPKGDMVQDIVALIPLHILEAAKHKKACLLDADKTQVFHYKKDDWSIWAYPMIYAIMDDINIIEKLKLADLAALDGAISNLRIFKLGSLDHKIAPTRAAAAKLASILGNNVGGGTMDLIWGPDIELIESKTTVHQFLGEAKYTPHLNSVYAGLGIPPTLTGTFGASGTTNNFISLKTLTQRLEYGRKMLMSFWQQEILLVQKAMGFKHCAKIEFDRMDLSNEDTEKSLLIQLVDRNLISDELLQSRFGLDPDMEKSRLNRENRDRKTERMVNKSGPWHDPQFNNALKKIALTGGIVTPSEVGLELLPADQNQLSRFDMSKNSKVNTTQLVKDSPESLPGVPEAGRPKLSQDTQKRKEKVFKPRTGATLLVWTNEAQEKISDIINPLILEYFNKKNVRSLSHEQQKHLEKIKIQALFALEPLVTVGAEQILATINISQENTKHYILGYDSWIKEIGSDLNRPLTMEEQKQIKSEYYRSIHTTE